MESEQLQNFNERLSQWVSNQGFWFQVRYSLSGSGMKGRAMFHLLRIAFRLLVFLMIIAVGVWIYLMKRTDSERFRSSLREDLISGLTATELEMQGVNRVQGQLEISRIAAEGSPDTFFSGLEARNIRCSMNLLDGLVGVWDPGIISMARLDLDFRAGADDEKSAIQLAEAVFRKPEAIKADRFEVSDATVRWGFSERTQGAIESSLLKAQRTSTGWRLRFKGGRFRQNWLQDLEIEELVVLCEAGGLVFETAKLKAGSGTVDFSGLRVVGGERPQVKGVVKVRSLNFDKILPSALETFVEGSISGDFEAFGSTNSSEGIGFQGQVVLDGSDTITLRERLHLLKALSVVDFSRNYRRVDFTEGSFQMKTTGGGLELTDVSVKSEDLFTLEGNLKVRLPTQEEIQTAVDRGSVAGGSPLFANEEPLGDPAGSAKEKSDFTLKRAALEAKRIQDGKQDAESISLFDRLGIGIELRRLQNQASDRMSRMLRYEGAFIITLPGDAFERAPRLQELYPTDTSTGRIPLRVPIEGNIYELTLKQAEDLYQQGQR